MTFDSWLLALHLLFAASLVGAVTVFWILVLAIRNADRPSQVPALAPLLRIGVIAGSLGSVVFGVWLAITLDAYHPWDGWVIAAIVLWAIGSETGRRTDPEYARAFTRARVGRRRGDRLERRACGAVSALCRPRTGMLLHLISSAAVLLILLDMIWKPGTRRTTQRGSESAVAWPTRVDWSSSSR